MPQLTGTNIGSRAGRRWRRPKTHPRDRVCEEDSCETRLSRYNPADRCYAHAPRRQVRSRGEFTEAYLKRRQGG